MVNRNLLREYDLPETELQHELEAAFRRDDTGGDVEDWLVDDREGFEGNKIVHGRVINLIGDEVMVDVGYKSEGIIPVQEGYDEGQGKGGPPQGGDGPEGLPDAAEAA